MHRNKLVAEYNYDAWGNCTVHDFGNMTNVDPFVVASNPFRWKGHFYDVDTGLYYIKGRYYDPEIMQYLDADDPENLIEAASAINGLDRNAITLDNILALLANFDNIFTASELFPDHTYDPNAGKSWWDLHWKKAVQWIIFAAVFIVSIVLMIIPGTQSFGIGMFLAGMKAAISGLVVGGLIGGIISAVQGNSFVEGMTEGAIYGFINGFSSGALLYCASQAVSALVKAANAAKAKPSPATIGKKGEQYVSKKTGLKKNTEIFEGTKKGRIPDFMDETNGILIESKNVAKQSLTSQLKDYVSIAESKGWSMELYVRQGTKLSESILNSSIIIKYFPW